MKLYALKMPINVQLKCLDREAVEFRLKGNKMHYTMH